MRSRSMPARVAVSAHCRNSRFTISTGSPIGGSDPHSAGRPRLCISTAPTFSSASVFTIFASQRKPLTSFTTSAPASTAARATLAL